MCVDKNIFSEAYAVNVEGNSVPVYSARVSAQPFNQVWPGYQRPIEQTEPAAFVSFDIDKPVTVQIISKVNIEKVEIRPNIYKVETKVIGNMVKFRINKPCQITVEINGYHNCLHLFANPSENFGIADASPDVRYFGPGVHEAGSISMKSGDTLYIAEGAIVYGRIEATDADHIKILGRGILCGSKIKRFDASGLINLLRCHHITVNGIVLCDPQGWTVILSNCSDIFIQNIKLVGLWRYNADGIDVVNSQRVKIDRCFIRSFDDCIAIKGMKNYEVQNVEDITVSNCTVWCDWGRAFEIGAETCANEIKNVFFKNCYIIRTTHIAMDIQHGDRAHISNVRFENINVEMDEISPRPKLQERAEDTYIFDCSGEYCPQLCVLEITHSMWSHDKECGTIDGVLLKNIHVFGNRIPESRLSGYDELHNVNNVKIENLYMRGKPVRNSEEGNFKIKDYVNNVIFSALNVGK